MPKGRGPLSAKAIARERIDILFGLAFQMARDRPDLANRYVELARRIGMRCRVRIPKRWRLWVCKGCGGLLAPGVSCRVRLRQDREPHLAITCLRCGEVRRLPIGGRERRSKR